MSLPLWRRLASYGTGVGFLLGESDLEAAVVRVRPTGASLAGFHRISGYHERPAAEWGAELLSFLARFGAERQAAIAVLPRSAALLRLLTLPNLNEQDTGSAVRFQLDTLHPFGEDDVVSGWVRLNPTQVAVGIAERRVVDAGAALLSEAGIRLAGVSFSGPVLHSALRVAGSPGSPLLAAWPDGEDSCELYAESPARPLFSAGFDMPVERAASLVRAEIRAAADLECLPGDRLLPWTPADSAATDAVDDEPKPSLQVQAAALAAACPHLGEPLNLLPEDRRVSTSRARYIPTLVLATLLAVTGIALLVQDTWLDRRYLNQLQSEIRKVEPAVARVHALDADTAELAARIRLLDSFRAQSRADLEVLRAVNRLVPPPGWVQQLQINRDSVQIGGEAPQAEGLLKLFDESPRFRGATFTMPLTRSVAGEFFRIRAQREEGAAQ